MVTVKLFTAKLKRVSDAKQVTVVVPIPNVEPEPGMQVTVRTPSTRSTAVAVNVTTLPDGPVASAMIFAGSVSTGSVVSRTLIVNESVIVTPHESITEHVTVVVAMGKTLPDVRLQVGVGSGLSSASVAVTEKLTTAPDGPVASTVISAGTFRVGAVFG